MRHTMTSIAWNPLKEHTTGKGSGAQDAILDMSKDSLRAMDKAFTQRVAVLAAMCMLPLRSLGLQFEKDVPVLSREVRSTLFPESSSMGLFLAVGIPLDEPYNDVSFSWNYEANYVLPYNASELSQYGYARRETRSLRDLSRTTAYLVLRHKFQSHGYDGETCLLKAICEAAATPMKGTSMIADILHVVFTPSTSVNEDLGPEYQLAENRGRSGEDCEEVYEDCPISLVQLISEIDD